MSTIELLTGLTLAYDHYGDVNDQPVVLLHGLSSNRRVFNPLLRKLTSGDTWPRLRLLNVDLRGHGESAHATLNSYDAPSYAEDIADLLRREAKSRPTIIIAESLGGIIGTALVERHPELVRALFLEDPPLFLADPQRLAGSPVSADFPEIISAVRELQARQAPITEYEALMADAASADELHDLCLGLSSWDPLTMQAAVDGTLWRGVDPLRPIRRPLTILRADPAEGAAFEEQDVAPMQAANPTVRVQLMLGATHSIRSTVPAAYDEELRKFLGSLELVAS